jgi:MtN3 and saliva related transmembrane protein
MTDTSMIQIIGAVAAIASVVSFSPQAWKVIQTRNVKGLSARMYALTVAAFALWLLYGILKMDWALIVPNGLCLILAGFILMMIMLPKPARAKVSKTIKDGK